MDRLLSDVVVLSVFGATTKKEFYVGLLALINQSKIYEGFEDYKMYAFSHIKVAIDRLFINLFFGPIED